MTFLDSGLRRNDRNRCFSTFYETISIREESNRYCDSKVRDKFSAKALRCLADGLEDGHIGDMLTRTSV
ncbi:MAG: hypothetical protein SWQ30_08705 [Thermodesulfobacteriota bacterium]|nr:hypothetical protein [Thermodesulfobacteriota bacterium]